MTELNIENYNIESIAGIEYFSNLESLNCMNNKIEDISNIKELSNIKTLLVADNFIEDIEAVSNLEKLEILNISHNNITDISPIKDLKNLEYPSINANPILDFSILCDKIDSMAMNEAKSLNLSISDSYIVNTKENMLNRYRNNEKAIGEMQKWVKANIKENMTELEKEYAIINHIIDKLEYVTDEETDSEVDLYKTYVEGKSVCFGYALTFQYLANFSGLESYQAATYLSAEEIDRGLTNHVWNIVKIDDKYYQLDITWADGMDGMADYRYINIGNKTMDELHNYELPIYKLEAYPETMADMPEEIQLKYQIFS